MPEEQRRGWGGTTTINRSTAVSLTGRGKPQSGGCADMPFESVDVVAHRDGALLWEIASAWFGTCCGSGKMAGIPCEDSASPEPKKPASWPMVTVALIPSLSQRGIMDRAERPADPVAVPPQLKGHGECSGEQTHAVHSPVDSPSTPGGYKLRAETTMLALTNAVETERSKPTSLTVRNLKSRCTSAA